MGQPLIDRSLEEFNEDGIQTVFVIAPFGATETRGMRIARLETLGTIDPNCPTCQREFYPHPTLDPFAPNHRPSPLCRSGKRPHCTCDGCF